MTIDGKEIERRANAGDSRALRILEPTRRSTGRPYGDCKFCGAAANCSVDLMVDHGIRWGVCDSDDCAEKSDAEVERLHNESLG